MGTFESPSIIEDMTFWVNVFSSTSVAHAMSIVGLIKTAMDNASLTITGYTAMKCVREYVGSVMFDNDTRIYSIPMRYRAMGSL